LIPYILKRLFSVKVHGTLVKLKDRHLDSQKMSKSLIY